MRTLSFLFSFFLFLSICKITKASGKESTEPYSDITIVLRKLPDVKPSQDFVRKPYEKNHQRTATRTIASTNNLRKPYYGCLSRGLCSRYKRNQSKASKIRAPSSSSKIKLKTEKQAKKDKSH